jgi:hypothetical protein
MGSVLVAGSAGLSSSARGSARRAATVPGVSAVRVARMVIWSSSLL